MIMEHTDIQEHQMFRAKLRKSTKPLLEKKRRARINSSLAQLKTLVLEAVKKDTARYSKLEKADVLDMTVRHLRNIQTQQLAVAMATDPTVLSKFRAGFSECVGEVSRYLSTIDGLEPEVRMRLLEHLATCMERRIVPQVAPPTNNMMHPIHIQIPQRGDGGNVHGHQTSSPPVGSLPPALQAVAMEIAHPLAMYNMSAADSLVTGSFHMVPNSMLYQNGLQHVQMKPERKDLVAMPTQDSKQSLPLATTVEQHQQQQHQVARETHVFKKQVKEEPVWRPW